MRGFFLGLSVSLAFIAGVLASSYLMPSAQARTKRMPTTILMRWEYLCIDKLDRNKLAEAGKQGWELVAGAAAGSHNGFTQSNTMVWCFKRPLL